MASGRRRTHRWLNSNKGWGDEQTETAEGKGKSAWARVLLRLLARGSAPWPYSIGDTLMTTTLGDPWICAFSQ